MTHRDLALLVSPDLNLSPAARVLVLHVATHEREGEGIEIAYADLHRLLGIKDLRALRREIAAAAGFVEVQTQTGRGHHPRFFYKGVQSAPVTDRGAESAPLNPDRGVQSAPLSAPPTTPTTTPPTPSTNAGAGVREQAGVNDPMLAALRAALGDHAHAVDAFAASANHPPNWPSQIWGFFRPPGTNGVNDGGGTSFQLLAGLNGRAAAVLAVAMGDYATKHKPFDGRYFRSFVERAAKDERKQRSDGGGGGDGGGGSRTSRGNAGRPAGEGHAERRDSLADAADLVS